MNPSKATGGVDCRDELLRLYLAYVNTLERGRDRIMMLGGTCDAVDVMEAGDPALIRARAALSKSRASGAEVEHG